ncbi:hypothetical protein [Pectobacterium carotovorum]|uniref:hypothetical protein n=1 Tax=Pectobacterium carotovorum TaxID=554 RepID=UPI0021C2AC09|nr:hypothetical protein [Pectobacterium carotovorum]GKW06312.1 hypothetical protein PEC301889_07950 [Pectobacterium carotovorum subsp. carotovorum]
MDINFFKKKIEPILVRYSFQYTSFLDGDFGDLERVEFEGHNKVGTVDFWSKGWISIDIYDLVLDDQRLNLLLGPDEEQLKAIETLVKLLNGIEENGN